MAYGEQTFTNLGQVQQPDPTQATGFAPVVTPFEVSDQTNNFLNNLTDNIIKRRENEALAFQKKLADTISSVKKESDDIDPKDLPEVTKRQNALIKKLYDNPKILAGMDVQGQRELDKELMEVHSIANTSKALKKIEDVYRKELLDNPNPVNQHLFSEWSKGTLEERTNKIFVPVSEKKAEMIKVREALLEQYRVNNDPIITDIMMDATDASGNPVKVPSGRRSEQISYTNDFEQVLPALTASYGQYPKMEYGLLSDAEKANISEEDYVKNYFLAGVPKEGKLPVKIVNDPEYAYRNQLSKMQEQDKLITARQQEKEKPDTSRYENVLNQYDALANIETATKVNNASQLGLAGAGDVYLVTDNLQNAPEFNEALFGEVKNKKTRDHLGDSVETPYTQLYLQKDKNGNEFYYYGYVDANGLNIDKDTKMSKKIIESKVLDKGGEALRKQKDNYEGYIANPPQAQGTVNTETFVQALIPTENAGGKLNQRNLAGSSALGNYQMIDSTRHSMYELMGVDKKDFAKADAKFKTDANYQKEVAIKYAELLDSKIPSNVQGAERAYKLAKGWYTGNVNFPDNKVPNPSQNKMTAKQYADSVLKTLGFRNTATSTVDKNSTINKIRIKAGLQPI